MKKIGLISLAVALCAAIAMPALAFDSQFGGYWRTRAYVHEDFNGADSGTGSFVDTRTRLYYTAIFSPDFKFVNKFEFNNFWGDNNGGDIGADGTSIFRIKNSYVDFNVGPTNWKIGEQGAVIARGFLFNDDFSGVTATLKLGSVTMPFYWMHLSDSDLNNATYGDSATPSKYTYNVDFYAISPIIKISDTVSINPYVVWDKESYNNDTNNICLGFDVDAKVDTLKLWTTLVYETGKIQDHDISAYLAAAGADAGLVHGQVFYASGDKTSTNDYEGFVGPKVYGTPYHFYRSYYWSEIMGYGIFDNVTSNNSPGDAINNVLAANLGVTVKPMDKLTLTGDVWYAQLAKKTAASNDSKDLGTELDLKATYQIIPNLAIDIVGAYLFAGNATGDKDPVEVGTQLSLSF
jgi:hypothetical protein